MRDVTEVFPRGSVLVTCIAIVLAMAVAPIDAGVAFTTHDQDRTTQGVKIYTLGGVIPTRVSPTASNCK